MSSPVTKKTIDRDAAKPLSSNIHLLNWVEKMAALTKPAAIHWVDGSMEEDEMLKAQMVESGTFIKLNQKLWPGCYYARSHPSDVARVFALAREVNPDLALFIMLAAATGARRSELLALRWSDIDLDKATWTVPRELTKMDRDHIVPLSKPVMLFLRSAHETRFGDYVFPGRTRGEPVGSAAGF